MSGLYLVLALGFVDTVCLCALFRLLVVYFGFGYLCLFDELVALAAVWLVLIGLLCLL